MRYRMKRITLNISILLGTWGLLVVPATIQAGAGDPVTLDPSIMKVFKIYILQTKNEVIEAHINLLMYYLSNNKHQNRLGPLCRNQPLDAAPLKWGITCNIEGVKTFLLYAADDRSRMLMALDFCEGYNDWNRLQLGECSEQQIILYTNQKEGHRTEYIGDYLYAAGVNEAASIKGKHFPWMCEDLYTKEKWKLAHKKSLLKYTEQSESYHPVYVNSLIMKNVKICIPEIMESDDTIALHFLIMENFQSCIPNIEKEVMEAHINLLMYSLAKNKHQNRLDPMSDTPLDIRPLKLVETCSMEEFRTFLKNSEDDRAKMLMILDFCEGYNDGARLYGFGECSEQQIILYANQSEKHRTKEIGKYIYAAGVNTATAIKKTYFPWGEERFYTKKQWEDAHRKLSQKEIQEFGF